MMKPESQILKSIACLIFLGLFAACATPLKAHGPKELSQKKDAALVAIAVTNSSFENSIHGIVLQSKGKSFELDCEQKPSLVVDDGVRVFVFQVKPDQFHAVESYMIGGRNFESGANLFANSNFKVGAGELFLWA